MTAHHDYCIVHVAPRSVCDCGANAPAIHQPIQECDVAGCGQMFATVEEVIEHERTHAVDALRRLIGNADCPHPSSSLAACQWCATDAVLANPNVVLAALGGTPAIPSTDHGRLVVWWQVAVLPRRQLMSEVRTEAGQVLALPTLELWGHDCTRCGNTVPMGEAPCDSCGKDDCLLPLYFKPTELAQMPEGL